MPPAALEPVRASNPGVEKIGRLGPNAGYLRISSFAPVLLVSGKFAAAMNARADTDGLIVDLRNNGGGGGDSVALLISYLAGGRTWGGAHAARPGKRDQPPSAAISRQQHRARRVWQIRHRAAWPPP